MTARTKLASRLESLMKGATTRRGAVLCIAIATLLAATSVDSHRALDDFVLALIARGEGATLGLDHGVLDLFTFTTGDPAQNRILMDAGLMLPWWTDPHLHIAFFRPLSSLTHLLDERLWGGSPALMHLHSLAWFAAMLGAAAFAFSRLETRALAGLSFVLFALDDAHGPVLSWIANRNALIATCFGCLALAFHDVWRQQKRPAFQWLATGAFVLGLLAGEFAIGALAYLAAYALYRDEGPARARLASLAPYAVVVVIWRGAWSLCGFGAKGSGAYIDPLHDPLQFLLVAPQRVLLLLQGQFSAPPADTAFLAPPPQVPAIVALSVLTFGVVLFLLVPILRNDKTSRFWATGTLLAVLPLSATFTSDRLLLFVGLGGAALVARIIDVYVLGWLKGERFASRTVIAMLFAVLHLVVAPLLLAARSAQMGLFAVAADKAMMSLPSTQDVQGRTVVIIAAPTLLFANYVPAERRLKGIPAPSYQYVLSSASSKITVERSGPRAITLRPEHGFLYTPLERHYRGNLPFRVGDEVRLSSISATIAEVQDGRPSAVTFYFDGPNKSYFFVTWKDGAYVSFTIPKAGTSVELPAEDFGAILGRTFVGLLTHRGES
jgi:hypothetical protein